MMETKALNTKGIFESTKNTRNQTHNYEFRKLMKPDEPNIRHMGPFDEGIRHEGHEITKLNKSKPMEGNKENPMSQN